MFRRIRETIEAFRSDKPAPHAVPDLIFVQEQKQELTSISRHIGRLFEGLLLTFAGGIVGEVAWKSLASKNLIHVSVGMTIGITSAISVWIGHALLNRLNEKVRFKLKIGERLAPYFGHRLYETYRILKG
jgi:hypothetical protein